MDYLASRSSSHSTKQQPWSVRLAGSCLSFPLFKMSAILPLLVELCRRSFLASHFCSKGYFSHLEFLVNQILLLKTLAFKLWGFQLPEFPIQPANFHSSLASSSLAHANCFREIDKLLNLHVPKCLWKWSVSLDMAVSPSVDAWIKSPFWRSW